METRNQSVFGHVKDDLSDIKTMLKMITAKLEKQSPALESTLANNGFFTSSGQSSHLMGVKVPISGSSVHGGFAHSLGGIQLLSPGNLSQSLLPSPSFPYASMSGLASTSIPYASIPGMATSNPLGHVPMHGNTHFHYPMVSNTFSNAPAPGFNHLQQLSTHNGNYSNSIPLIEYNMLKFDGGEDVRSWISKCERVFILENTPQNCKVQRATIALEGSAFIWHRVYTHQKFGISWQDYSQAIMKRFDKRKYAIKECSGEESHTPILSVWTQGMDTSSSSTSNENEAKDDLLITHNEETDGNLPYVEPHIAISVDELQPLCKVAKENHLPDFSSKMDTEVKSRPGYQMAYSYRENGELQEHLISNVSTVSGENDVIIPSKLAHDFITSSATNFSEGEEKVIHTREAVSQPANNEETQVEFLPLSTMYGEEANTQQLESIPVVCKNIKHPSWGCITAGIDINPSYHGFCKVKDAGMRFLCFNNQGKEEATVIKEYITLISIGNDRYSIDLNNEEEHSCSHEVALLPSSIVEDNLKIPVINWKNQHSRKSSWVWSYDQAPDEDNVMNNILEKPEQTSISRKTPISRNHCPVINVDGGDLILAYMQVTVDEFMTPLISKGFKLHAYQGGVWMKLCGKEKIMATWMSINTHLYKKISNFSSKCSNGEDTSIIYGVPSFLAAIRRDKNVLLVLPSSLYAIIPGLVTNFSWDSKWLSEEVYRILKRPILLIWGWYYKDREAPDIKCLKERTVKDSHYTGHLGNWLKTWKIAWQKSAIFLCRQKHHMQHGYLTSIIKMYINRYLDCSAGLRCLIVKQASLLKTVDHLKSLRTRIFQGESIDTIQYHMSGINQHKHGTSHKKCNRQEKNGNILMKGKILIFTYKTACNYFNRKFILSSKPAQNAIFRSCSLQLQVSGEVFIIARLIIAFSEQSSVLITSLLWLWFIGSSHESSGRSSKLATMYAKETVFRRHQIILALPFSFFVMLHASGVDMRVFLSAQMAQPSFIAFMNLQVESTNNPTVTNQAIQVNLEHRLDPKPNRHQQN